MTSLQKIGAGMAFVSITIGLCGMLWSVYPAFVAEVDADYAAIPSRWFDCAIWFAILTIAGGAMATALIIVGRHTFESENRR